MRDDHKGDRKDAHAKLWSMIKGIRVAMLTSWDGHRMHTRPMHGYQEEFSGELWFFTKLDSGKTHEVMRFD
jgi:general stress protein 26